MYFYFPKLKNTPQHVFNRDNLMMFMVGTLDTRVLFFYNNR